MAAGGYAAMWRWFSPRRLLVFVAVGFGIALGMRGVQSQDAFSANAMPRRPGPSGPVTVLRTDITWSGVVVTIHNGLTVPIFVGANHTNCTLVRLEKLVNNSWKTESPCEQALPNPYVVAIGPGTDLVQVVSGRLELVGSYSMGYGTYRAAVPYTMSPNQPSERGGVAYSEAFVFFG